MCFLDSSNATHCNILFCNIDDIFFFKRNEKGESLDELKRNDIISYNVGFNYCGPIAVNIKIKQN